MDSEAMEWDNLFPDYRHVVTDDDKKLREDFDLAKQFCPRLYVDPRLFAKERAALARDLKIKGIPFTGLLGIIGRLHLHEPTMACNAIFRMFASEVLEHLDKNNPSYQECLNQYIKRAQLWLINERKNTIGKISGWREFLEDNRQHPWWRNDDYKNDEARLDFALKMEKILLELSSSKKSIESIVNSLFLDIFPNELTHTCVIKYNVVHHPADEHLRCIEYFFYWPIQIFPYHYRDYGPVYVYVYLSGKDSEGKEKNDVLAVLFNSAPSLRSSIKRTFTKFKRPGHLIRAFFNYNVKIIQRHFGRSESTFFSILSRYNDQAELMTKIYSGEYAYEQLSSNGKEVHTNRLLDDDGRIALCIPLSLGFPIPWHAFDICTPEMRKRKNWGFVFDLMPLNDYDLLHIEWNVQSPFQSPFLYPILGGKNPLSHYPFDFRNFSVYDQDHWKYYCKDEWFYPFQQYVSFQRAWKLIELLSAHISKNRYDPTAILPDFYKMLNETSHLWGFYEDECLGRKSIVLSDKPFTPPCSRKSKKRKIEPNEFELY